MRRIVLVRFQPAGRHYHFDALDLDLRPGSRVIVETDRGRAMATVVTHPEEVPDEQAPDGLKSLLRQATEEDLELAEKNAAREKDAYRYCMERIQARRMEMKLVRAEYAFDGSKIIFYFTADGRVDFRELVKDLAHHFHTRIEMRQIGVRDEAKLVGGIGICGRELCCCSFLTEFSPVSVKMAKEQGLALNPGKISGQCGRLLCCLSYEYETYRSLKKGLPKCGKKVCWKHENWEVRNQDVLGQKLTLRKEDGTTQVVTAVEFEEGRTQETPDNAGANAEKPPTQADARQTDTSNRRPAGRSGPAKPADAGKQKTEGGKPDGDQSGDKPGKRRKRSRRRRKKRPTSPKQGE